MTIGLGIDGGGTATRWKLADADGQTIASGTAAPLSGHLFSTSAEERARQIIDDIAQTVSQAGKPIGVVAGITGLTREAPAESAMRSMLASALGVSEQRVFVAEDMWIAYLAHFALGEGILVYSGTGSIGYYLTEAKTVIRVGGLGNLIDDGGSGFWIAREALKVVLRAEEEAPGSGWSTPLGEALAKAIGGTSWNNVRTFVYGGDRGRIGTLGRAVADAAVAGDVQALAILEAAGRELARLANSLIKQLGPRPVALMGGASRMHPAILNSFRENLIPPSEVVVTEVDPALTAARLAATLPG